LRRFAFLFATLLVAAGLWAAFWTTYNPPVAGLPPLVLERPASQDHEVTVLLGGDFAPADAAMPFIAEHGYHYPYEATRDLFAEADVAFANLESPVTTSNDRFPLFKKYLYKVAPEATESWKWLGLDLVSLANNHVSDYRDRGLLDTLHHLDAAGLAHVGGGADEPAARRAVIFAVGGVKIGFLGYLEDRAQYNLYMRTFAVAGRPGCARALRSDLAEDIRRLRPAVDVLIVSIHWGDNYKPVTDEQEDLGRWLIDQGVDVVAGHHPHDVQPVEVRGRGVIIYSLGNYAWGAIGHGHLRVGFLARLRIDRASRRVAAVELVPIATQNRLVEYQPRPLQPDEWPWLDGVLAASRARGGSRKVAGSARMFGHRYAVLRAASQPACRFAAAENLPPCRRPGTLPAWRPSALPDPRSSSARPTSPRPSTATPTATSPWRRSGPSAATPG
jgi:hypothetical protein